MHCINYFNALINTLLTQPGLSKGRVGESYPKPNNIWGPECTI